MAPSLEGPVDRVPCLRFHLVTKRGYISRRQVYSGITRLESVNRILADIRVQRRFSGGVRMTPGKDLP